MFIPTLCSLNNSKEIPFNSIKYFSRSFKHIENKNGDKFSSCLTPVRQGTNSDWLLLYCTQDFISLYILHITLKIYPFISLLSSFSHKPGETYPFISLLSIDTVSNALLKSTKVQSIVFPNRTDTMKLIHLKRKCYQL